MTQAAEKLKSELTGLEAAERAELARFLIASLDKDVDEDAEAVWDEELARRAEAIRIGKATGRPADQVLADLRAKYS